MLSALVTSLSFIFLGALYLHFFFFYLLICFISIKLLGQAKEGKKEFSAPPIVWLASGS